MIFLVLSAFLLSISTPLSVAFDNISIAVGVIGLILYFKKIRLKDLDFRVLGVSAVGLTSSLFSIKPLYSLKNSHYLWHFLPYFIVSRIKREKLKVILVVLGGAAILSAFAVIFQAFTGIRINHTHLSALGNIHLLIRPVRAEGLFSAPLTTAGIIAPLMFIFFSQTLFEKELKLKVYYSIVFFFTFVALVLNFSRSYWLGSVAAVLMLPFIYSKNWVSKIIPLSGIALALLMYIFFPPVHKRVQTVIHYNRNVSAMDRIALWEAGINLYKNYNIKYKLIGCGSGNLYHFLKPFLVKSVKVIFGDKNVKSHLFSSVHNEYLQVLLKWGVVGLLVWLYLWIYVLYKNIVFIKKTDNEFFRSLAIGLTMGFIAFLVGGFFEHNVGDAEVIILIMFLLGINKNILDSLKEGAI